MSAPQGQGWVGRWVFAALSHSLVECTPECSTLYIGVLRHGIWPIKVENLVGNHESH